MEVPAGHEPQPAAELDLPGRTLGVPFTPLESNIQGRAEATQADDAEVDLSPWRLANETPRQTKARQVLRRFAHRMWVKHQEEVAFRWLNSGDRCKTRTRQLQTRSFDLPKRLRSESKLCCNNRRLGVE